MTQKDIDNIINDNECWLNGRPARICGRLRPHGLVAAEDGIIIEYSWPAIVRIMAGDKLFKS